MSALQAVVAHSPEAIAIETLNAHGVTRVSYASLDKQAKALAEELRCAGVEAGETVGISCDRSLEHVVAMLAIWMRHAAFVVLDSSQPEARREKIRHRAGVRCSVNAVGITHHENARKGSTPRGLAYVCFSSGSSGEPKGIAVGHQGIVPMLRAQIDAFALRGGARALWLYHPSFDASLSDIGTTLLSGATLVIHPADLKRDPHALMAVMREHAITHLDVPPSLLPHLTLAELSALECIVLGGESADVLTVQKLAAVKRVVNVYGPTEATVCTSLVRCGPGWSRPTVGLPLPHITYRIASSDGLVLDVDEGELWIAGPCLAQGYLGDEGRTASRFVTREGVRYFRSGDKVRRAESADGWELGARMDRQRKIDGKLVSPEEVERVLAETFGLKSCVVCTRSEPLRLVAFLEGKCETPELRRGLAQKLPAHMIPWRFVTQAMPRLSNGKIDTQALTDLADALVRGSRETADTSSRGLLLRQLAGSRDASRTLDELGASSLDRVALLAALRQEGRSVSTAMLSHLSIGELWDAPRTHDEATVDELQRYLTRIERAPQSHSASCAGEPSLLFTGATGFLGRHWVRVLLETSSRRVLCLVRGRDEPAARERLHAALGTLSGPQRARLEVVSGDVAEPFFGLPRERYEGLASRVDHVVHSAAAMSVVESREGLWNANVQGTARVLDFVHTGAAKSLDYVSTLAVLASTDRPDPVFLEEDDALAACRIFGGYAQTKWCAEQLVRTALAASTSSLRIHRLGLLVGNHATSDWLTNAILGLVEVGAYPDDLDPELALDITRVGDAARACAALHDAPSGTFHVRGRTVLFLDLVRLLRELGEPLARVSREAFQRLLIGHPSIGTFTLQLAMERTSAEHGGFDLFLATRRAFSMARTLEALAQRGVTLPSPSEREIALLLRDILLTRAKESGS